MGEFVAGLEGVIASRSRLSFIDGEKGVLAYCGYDIADLAAHSTFEETCGLLWTGGLPKRAALGELRARMAEGRFALEGGMRVLEALPRRAHPMEALRSAISALSPFDPDGAAVDHEANLRKAVRLTAQTATLLAAFERMRRGGDLIPPPPGLSHAASFLFMVDGKRPSARMEKALDIALVLHADHGFNASTFAARVVASTLSDMHSAVTAAVGALKGPLHGGANERVVTFLEEVAEPARAEAAVRSALAAKKRIMGFGHRVYRTIDPRATILRRIAKDLARGTEKERLIDIAEAVEKVMAAEKRLYPNVDFFSAIVYDTLGFPNDLYTPLFVLSRMAGWTAHVIEQQDDNRLFRPREEYVGPTGLAYIPLEER